jgi:ribosome-binding protein aMBF1 (putative translation factor)
MTMAKKRLPKGWTEGTAQELLGLTDEEAAMVEIRVRLANKVREIRAKKRISQEKLAARIGSTQPRVCKAEQAEASFDMLVRSLLALGVDRKEIGRAIAN